MLYNQLVGIISKICNASQRVEKFGILVSGMMLKFFDISNGNTASNLGDNLEEKMNELFPQIIDKFRT